jgi:predicted phage terminase large subunit-like protein
VLILDPRGFLKTTINAQSHTIQWILNYPDIAILMFQSNIQKAEMIIGEIKQHFQANPRFRDLFPDHCPTKRVWDWGTKGEFTSEARGVTITRKEPTLMAASIDKGSAGIHVDVMKFSDIVEPNNVKTDEQIAAVIQAFGMAENLLVSPAGWIDVEGTRYDFSDLYGEIIKAEMTRPPEEREWRIHVRGVYRKDTGGAQERFTPEELDLPYRRDENGQKISWWPERWSVFELEKRRKNPAIGEYIFACQQLNNPVEVGDESQVPFPVNKEYPKWISRDNFRKNVRVVHRTVTVDTAETQSDRADYSCITTVAWDTAGRPYVDEIQHGKWLPDELIRRIIGAQMRYNPLKIAIEETSFVRGLMPSIRRQLDVHGLHINFDFVKRENTVSKKERILNTLQPWYKSGDLRFLDDIEPKEELIEELRRFPKYRHDDILDTLADQFQNREWFGRLAPRDNNPWDETKTMSQRQQIVNAAFDHWLGIDDMPSIGGYRVPGPYDNFFSRTGGL